MNTLVLLIHGVEFEDKDFDTTWSNTANEFAAQIDRYMGCKQKVTYRPVNWNKLIADRERITKNLFYDWHWRKLIDVMTFGACDILWYIKAMNSSNKTLFDAVHAQVDVEIENGLAYLGDDTEIVLIGHSWGSQIALNHCFLSQYRDKIKGLVTFGSPILWISGAFSDWGMPPAVRFWLNFYNRFDIISSAISRNPNPSFKNTVVDIDVTPKFTLAKWLPLKAHCAYWKNPLLHKSIAEAIQSIAS